MSILTFKGGIHPFEGKNMSKSKPITDYMPKGDLVYPLSQHIGAPAEAVVNIGDRVLLGQLIAKATSFVSANIHASVSGKVTAIEPRKLAAGNMCMSIVVENDYLYEEMPITDNRKTEDLSKEDILEIIKNAGIVGMGGACFPTHVKLSPKEPDRIDYIIVNGSECEPYLTSDYRRMIETPEIIIEGLRYVLSLFNNAKGIIAVEDNKLDAIVKLKKLLVGAKDIEVKELFTKYPQGGERSLIYATTNRKINSSMLPADAGCIVHNIDTITAIYNAVKFRKPLTKRIVTVTGDAIRSTRNFSVPIGTEFKELIDEAGGLIGDPRKVIAGGPMMGVAMQSLNVPIVKGSSAILCLKNDQAAISAMNCINCGRCVKVCPERLIPSLLAKNAEFGDKDKFTELNGLECVECGCCSYVCPSKRFLTQAIKSMRRDILASRKK